MTTRAHVCAAIDSAAAAFNKCWDTLVLFKHGPIDEQTAPRIGAFQHDLASGLLKLEKAFLKLATEKDNLIKRKPHVQATWFARRMAKLQQYQDAVEDAMRIGKTIGDTFAWFFYMRENELIEEHLQHEGQLHMPPGIGAAGEMAFIQNVKPFGQDHLVLYHGTTTFLRVGDVSFIHLPTMTVSALGEIKTKKSSDTELSISLFLLGDSRQLRLRMPSFRKVRRSRRRSDDMPSAKREQLRRQLDRMSGALDASEADKRLEVRQLSHLDKLDEIGERLKRERFVHLKLDDGLMLLGIKLSKPSSRLSSRLLPRHVVDTAEIVDASGDAVHQIIDKSRSDNSLILDRLWPGFIPGMSPLFWSPVSASLVKRIIFREIYFQTWFNPVHLVQKLERAGMEVTTGRLGLPATVKKRLGRRTASARAIDTMYRLITQQLADERSFVDFVTQTVDMAPRSGASPNVEVRMPLVQFYGDPPPPLERRYRRQRRRAQRPGA